MKEIVMQILEHLLDNYTIIETIDGNENPTCKFQERTTTEDFDSEDLAKKISSEIKFKTMKTTDFKTAAMPLIRYMAENLHPHHTVVVTAINAELSEGKESTGHVLDFLLD